MNAPTVAPLYASYFSLKQAPFSIAPDPRYLYMSDRHREALALLLYGLSGGGGFVLLTGAIGAGKTTVCRAFLEQIPENCDVGYVFNPKLTVPELMRTICEEFGLKRPPPDVTVKEQVDALNEFLLKNHAEGRYSVLIIDEAQNLAVDVLEQLRLLTNLETAERKLLQIILIGQPELRDMLRKPRLEQLAQRVIARYHLEALSEVETLQYVAHRMAVAGLPGPLPFDSDALMAVHRLARGVPRRINLLCDRAMLGAFGSGLRTVSTAIVEQAAREVFDDPPPEPPPARGLSRRDSGLFTAFGLITGAALATLALGLWVLPSREQASAPASAARVASGALSGAGPASAGSATTPATPRPAGSVVPALVSDATSAEDVFAAAIRSPEAARASLAQLWKVPAGQGGDCLQSMRNGLACWRTETASLPLIRQLDRPALLHLSMPDGPPAHVLLVGLGTQHARVRAAGLEATVSLGALTRRWRGEFTTFWRVPPGYLGSSSTDDNAPLAPWLVAQLDALGVPATSGGVPRSLHERVSAFQLSQGLPTDGVAGSVTLMQLNRALRVDEPRLQALP